MNITRAQLIDCITNATQSMEVHVPCQDYYARRGDSQTETLSYINPDVLIDMLSNLEEE